MTHLVVVHPPQLDLPVVGPADDQWHARVEVGPVHPPGGEKTFEEAEQRQTSDVTNEKTIPVVTLQHMLHNSISLAKEVWGAWFH